MDLASGLFSPNHCPAATSLTLNLLFLSIHNGFGLNKVKQPIA